MRTSTVRADPTPDGTSAHAATTAAIERTAASTALRTASARLRGRGHPGYRTGDAERLPAPERAFAALGSEVLQPPAQAQHGVEALGSRRPAPELRVALGQPGDALHRRVGEDPHLGVLGEQ